MKVYRMDQYSDEWWSVRRGIPTASCASKIITAVKGDLSTQHDKYISHLIAEHLGLEGSSTFQSKSMERGSALEENARSFFEFDQLPLGVKVDQVGFITNDDGTVGLSPDGLYKSSEGQPVGLEIKAPDPVTHISWLREFRKSGSLPKEHKGQVHWSIAVAEIPWTFLSFCPGLDPLIIQVAADDYTKKVSAAIEQFTKKLAEEKKRLEIT